MPPVHSARTLTRSSTPASGVSRCSSCPSGARIGIISITKRCSTDRCRNPWRTSNKQPHRIPVAEPFLSEIRLFSFNFAPRGWALCNGQILPINQNQALFSLLGTTYGGDGRVNFALPNLQGRVPIHTGNGHTLGQNGGEQAHALSMA